MLVSLFTEPVLRDAPCSLEQVDGTVEVKNRIKKLKEISVKLESNELMYLQPDHFSDFSLCYDYIDIAYDWASGETIGNIVANYLIPYEVPVEAFCKNMTKISNILDTFD